MKGGARHGFYIFIGKDSASAQTKAAFSGRVGGKAEYIPSIGFKMGIRTDCAGDRQALAAVDYPLKAEEPLVKTPAAAALVSEKPASEALVVNEKTHSIKSRERQRFLLQIGFIGIIFAAVALYEAIFRTLLL